MMVRVRRFFPLVLAAGVVLALGSSPAAFAKGPTISVGDDPTLKEGSPKLVLVEVSDFQ